MSAAQWGLENLKVLCCCLGFFLPSPGLHSLVHAGGPTHVLCCTFCLPLVCLPVLCLPAYLSISLAVCLFVSHSLPFSLLVCLPACLPACLFVRLSVCLLSLCMLSPNLPACLHAYLCVCLSVLSCPALPCPVRLSVHLLVDA